MAGERKGKTYEALIKVTLDRLKAAGKVKGEVFWNKTPRGMTIEPDFTIGKDEDHPTHQLLVTHSGSAKESEKKLWRNMGELAEGKLLLSSVPRVFNIAFDSVIKEDLKKIQAAAFDGQLIIGDLKYGRALQHWVDSNHGSLPTNAEDKADEIKKLVGTDKTLDQLVKKLCADLELTLKQSRPELDQLWAMDRKRRPGKAPVAKTTFVRRGLSKLLIFEDIDLALRLYRGQKVRVEEVPGYAYELGLAKKAIGRAAPGDGEISNVIGLLSDLEIKSLVESAPKEAVAGWLTALRNSHHLEFIGQYVLSHYRELSDPILLARKLVALAVDENALVDETNLPENWPPRNNWLFEYLLELIKFSTGNANGFGYAKLALEAQELPGMPPANDPVYRINLPDWVLRRGKLNLDRKIINGISLVVSAHLARIGATKAAKLIDQLKVESTNNTLEAKLMTYRMFEPLVQLIQSACGVTSMQNIKACFAEAAGLKGAAGKTRVLFFRNTLLNWQSVSDAGRDHKKKELCGRALGLRYSWDSKSKKFIPRPGIKKLILALDGTWRQDDLDALVRAGWDEIFYPDEMDKLAKAIV